MYKKNQNRQYQFTDFNQPVGLKMDPENRWVKKAAMIPWDAIEEKIYRNRKNLSFCNDLIATGIHKAFGLQKRIFPSQSTE